MVLVPLEPDEAPARLAHILSEVRAAHLQAEYRRTRTTCAIYTRLLTGGPFDLPVSLSQVCPSVIVTQDNEVRLRVLSAIASLDGADEAKAWRGSGLEVLTVHQVQDLASSTEAGPSNAASGCLDAEPSAEIAMGLQAGDVGAEQVSHERVERASERVYSQPSRSAGTKTLAPIFPAAIDSFVSMLVLFACWVLILIAHALQAYSTGKIHALDVSEDSKVSIYLCV
jgi:hypothetical protein